MTTHQVDRYYMQFCKTKNLKYRFKMIKDTCLLLAVAQWTLALDLDALQTDPGHWCLIAWLLVKHTNKTHKEQYKKQNNNKTKLI